MMEKAEAQLDIAREAETTSLLNYEMVRKPSRKQRRCRAAAAAADSGTGDDCRGELVGADSKTFEAEAILTLARLGVFVHAIKLASTSVEGLVMTVRSVADRMGGQL